MKNFLSIEDLSKEEINIIIANAIQLKHLKRCKNENNSKTACIQNKKNLEGKNIVLLFEKDSTRTRCAFEVAAHQEGANITYIGSGSHFMHKESVSDTVKVLDKMYDCIVYRGYAQKTIEIMAASSNVPIINALTNESHPTQFLADLMTIKEYSQKDLSNVNLAYLGDARYNTANTLMLGSSIMGINFNIGCPKEYMPHEKYISLAKQYAQSNSSQINIYDDKLKAVKNADFIYTDVWVSMGENENVLHNRINALKNYRIDMQTIAAAENKNVKFLHCLPAIHDKNTTTGKKIFDQYEIEGLEVSNEVFESEYSIVFEQAENRLHSIRALLLHLLA